MLIDILLTTVLGIVIFFIIEFIIKKIVFSVRKQFSWLITGQDEIPSLSKTGLAKFVPQGFDSELGWVRKPLTSNQESGKYSKTEWNINKNGVRTNPSFDNLNSLISCYGDSFTFSRQVNDDETWPHYLSKSTNSNVLNFGVGNYGIDQSLLRLKREFPKNKTDIVILAVVPETICRILSVWKHYYEYGNTFGFKPRFIIKGNKLVQLKNPIDNTSKFEHYEDYLEYVKANDFFYKNKFLKEKINFPYSITILKNFRRNFEIISWVRKIEQLKKQKKDFSKIEWNPMKIIMQINLNWRVKLFQDPDSCELLKMIMQEYVNYSKKMNFKPIFLFLPQKDDLTFIKNNFHFFKEFQDKLKSIEDLILLDVTDSLLREKNLDDFYSDYSDYGGHFTKYGNKIISELIAKQLKNFNLV